MKFIDATELYDIEDVELAVLSTFQFDAEYFERRLLRTPALSKARRIAVFVDASQWCRALSQDFFGRQVNKRYLVIPVFRSSGVFHPKLNVFLTRTKGLVHCGSNNLTKSGMSSNLELLNSLRFDVESSTDYGGAVACKEAVNFFLQACDNAEVQAGRVARKWLNEAANVAPWIGLDYTASNVELIHTYSDPIWARWLSELNGVEPTRILIISPFHDKDASLAKKVLNLWPKCSIEIVVQQNITTLPIEQLKNFKSRLTLSEIRDNSRRVHAKLLAWESKNGTGCIIGSANFTSAAFNGINVETCLISSSVKDEVAAIFDGRFDKRVMPFDDFQPGKIEEPSAVDDDALLFIESAIVTEDGELSVSYRSDKSLRGWQFYLGLRLPSEIKPRKQFKVRDLQNGSSIIKLDADLIVDSAVMISLVAESGSTRLESAPNWVILESRLIQQDPGDKSSSADYRVEETGDGLAEYLDAIAKRDGVAAAIEYLRRLSIRFQAGDAGSFRLNSFKLHIRDPYKSDEAPEWLLTANEHFKELVEAIFSFADRHEQERLRRHARKGNVNGLPNFLDIFHALVRTLYIYYVRGIVDRHQFVARVSRYIQIAAAGIDTETDYSDGYLSAVSQNLGGDEKVLQVACNEVSFIAHLFAAMMIAQRVRFVPGEILLRSRAPQRPRDCLATSVLGLRETVRRLGLQLPLSAEVLVVIKSYNMFSEIDADQFLNEMIV